MMLLVCQGAFSQEESLDSLQMMDYSRQREFVIADIQVKGVKYLNPTHLSSISGLQRGQKIQIPGDDISQAIKKYWKHGLFSDVKIVISKIEGDKAYLEIHLKEHPRLVGFEISGLRKGETTDLKDDIGLRRGIQVTDNVINNSVIIIKKHFLEKGYFNTEIDVRQVNDTAIDNGIKLIFHVNKNKRVKIEELIFEGNQVYTDKRLRRTMKKTKQRDLNIFKGSKYIEKEYRNDKASLIAFYNENGYRDARIVNEELVELNDKRVGLKITLEEGNKYYIRSINWVGNTKYPSDYLSAVLGVKEGDIYDKSHLDDRLQMDEDAVSSVYMDNGYLFFNVSPVEVNIENDSVDIEMRIYEGEQARINKVIIRGNTKTNEHVVRRELFTRPGELFSKTDLIRSHREIASLGHFDPETIGINPLPNPSDGSVDIEYTLEEKANDQLELSGGWGGYGFVGSIGVRFTNMSVKNFFDPDAWRPVPTGDGQTLSLRAQSNIYYHSFSVSFMEPWFGGKKANSFSTSFNYTIQKNRYTDATGYLKVLGGSVGLGKRLKWPDDYFSIYNEVSLQVYDLKNYPGFGLDDGKYNMLSFKTVLSRNSQDQLIYPRRGSNLSLGLQFTPPYSLFDKRDYGDLTDYEKYKNIEFHKWTFDAAWYTALIGDLVLAVKAQFGYLGYYNEDIGQPRFEKFRVGGSGLSGYNFYGTDIIALRGYDEGALEPRTKADPNDQLSPVIGDGNVYTRYFMELRYPVMLKPQATIYGLAFIEGGNNERSWADYNPFAVKRSAGFGIRAFLPMFGLLGFDWAYGFDSLDGQYTSPMVNQDRTHFHFMIGQQF